MKNEKFKRRHDKDKSSEAGIRCAWIHSSEKTVVIAVERKDPVI